MVSKSTTGSMLTIMGCMHASLAGLVWCISRLTIVAGPQQARPLWIPVAHVCHLPGVQVSHHEVEATVG